MPKGNRSKSRGTGFSRTALTALNKAERDAFDAIAQAHGYIVHDGPRQGQGNALYLALAIISGEVATVLMEEDQRWYAIGKLEQSGDDVLIELAANLRTTAEREQAREREEIAEYFENRLKPPRRLSAG